MLQKIENLRQKFFMIAFQLTQDETGASLVEYALLLALIAVVSIAVATGAGAAVSNKFSTISTSLQ